MNIFQKEVTLQNALVQFRREIGELNLPPEKRISAMEKFKKFFLRSFDYDLATTRVFDDLMFQKSFKDVWKEMPTINKLFGFNQAGVAELDRMRTYIDRQLKAGIEAAQIINQLTYDARENLGIKFTASLEERIKLWVLQEKVKLEDQGEI